MMRARKTSARNGSRLPSKPSSNAARRGCPPWPRRRPFPIFSGAENKREKWQQVAIEAIKQCGATWLPTVAAPQTISDFLGRGEKIELALVGSLQTQRRHPRAWFQEFQQQHERLPHSAGVWIGPEGDFTLDELKTIQNSGARPVTLGNLVLRVETAAIYCLAFLNYELNR